jgi:tetrahydromethanopterin S-methyltransferase subunit B
MRTTETATRPGTNEGLPPNSTPEIIASSVDDNTTSSLPSAPPVEHPHNTSAPSAPPREGGEGDSSAKSQERELSKPGKHEEGKAAEQSFIYSLLDVNHDGKIDGDDVLEFLGVKGSNQKSITEYKKYLIDLEQKIETYKTAKINIVKKRIIFVDEAKAHIKNINEQNLTEEQKGRLQELTNTVGEVTKKLDIYKALNLINEKEDREISIPDADIIKKYIKDNDQGLKDILKKAGVRQGGEGALHRNTKIKDITSPDAKKQITDKRKKYGAVLITTIVAIIAIILPLELLKWKLHKNVSATTDNETNVSSIDNPSATPPPPSTGTPTPDEGIDIGAGEAGDLRNSGSTNVETVEILNNAMIFLVVGVALIALIAIIAVTYIIPARKKYKDHKEVTLQIAGLKNCNLELDTEIERLQSGANELPPKLRVLEELENISKAKDKGTEKALTQSTTRHEDIVSTSATSRSV